MLIAPIPENEEERLAALQGYCILDTAPEPAFDRLTRLAKTVMNVPYVLISLVDSHRQWFKSRVGVEAEERARGTSFCGHAIYHREPLIVPNALEDPRFSDNPIVTAENGVVFYAGIPLVTPDGFALGTLCVFDNNPRPRPSDEQIAALSDLAASVVDALELRSALMAVTRRQNDLNSLAKLLQLTLDSVSQGIASYDANDRMVAWNTRYIELLGLPPSLAKAGTHFSETLRKMEENNFFSHDIVAELKRAVALRIDSQLEWFRDLDEHAFELTVKSIQDGGTVTTLRDVTAQRRLASELARRLAQREQMERLKNEFVSTVSHELRTPLTSIAGMLEFLDAGVAGDLPEEARAMVEIAYKNSQRLIRLINDILDIEKIESGQMPFKIEPRRIEPIVQAAIEETRSYAQALGVSFVMEAADPAVVCPVDTDRLMQVLTNLLSNAAKYSPESVPVEVRVQTFHEHARITVRDRGPGISESFRCRIFEKFAQSDGSDARHMPGTGLGLAIVKQIVERLDGRVFFETECGAGTSFHVELPLIGVALAAE